MENIKVEIRIIEDTMDLNNRHLVTGIVFFDFGSFQFPESKWNDSVAVVLGWWLMGFLSFVKEQAKEVELIFMDGPFRILIQREFGDDCLARCIEGPTGREVFECRVSSLQILKALLSAATQVQRVCYQRGWQSADIDALAGYVGESRRVLVSTH